MTFLQFGTGNAALALLLHIGQNNRFFLLAQQFAQHFPLHGFPSLGQHNFAFCGELFPGADGGERGFCIAVRFAYGAEQPCGNQPQDIPLPGREGGKIEVTVTRVGDNAEIKVSDDGIGIAQEDIPKIWDRFYRADPSRSSDGFGLGLALVRQIALLHSGSVSVESRLGDGSTFTVTLPLDK